MSEETFISRILRLEKKWLSSKTVAKEICAVEGESVVQEV